MAANGKLPTNASESDATHTKSTQFTNITDDGNASNINSSNNNIKLINDAQSSNVNNSNTHLGTNRFLDSHQVDCGSNQSGSDSGLGYTNSLSSDSNSLFNTTVPAHSNISINNIASSPSASTKQARTEQLVNSSNNNKINSTNSNLSNHNLLHQPHHNKLQQHHQDGCTGTCANVDYQSTGITEDKSTKNKLNVNTNIVATNEPHDNNHSHSGTGGDASKSSSTSRSTHDPNNSLREQRQQWQTAIDETTTSDSSSQLSASPTLLTNRSKSTIEAQSGDNLYYAAIANVYQDSGNTSANTTNAEVTLTNTLDNNAPVDVQEEKAKDRCQHFATAEQTVTIPASPSTLEDLVSSLNSSLPLKSVLKKTRDPRSDARVLRHKNVSFNQTVIVYCEEVDNPLQDDFYEPPLGYKDPLDNVDNSDTFDRPNNYHERKESKAVAKNIGDVISRVMSENAPHITDDQLFGMLENESLLDEFKLDSSDIFDANLRLDNQSDPSRGYLCNGAISDDSDTETSLLDTRQKPLIFTDTDNVRVTGEAQRRVRDNGADNFMKTQQSSVSSSRPEKNAKIIASPLIKTSQTTGQPSDNRPIQRKSMPARMKVSAVENNGTKRVNAKKIENDLKPVTNGAHIESQSHSDQQRQSMCISDHMTGSAKHIRSQHSESSRSNMMAVGSLCEETTSRKVKAKVNERYDLLDNLKFSSTLTHETDTTDRTGKLLNQITEQINSVHQPQLQQQSRPTTVVQNQRQEQDNSTKLRTNSQVVCQLCKAAEVQGSYHEQTHNSTSQNHYNDIPPQRNQVQVKNSQNFDNRYHNSSSQFTAQQSTSAQSCQSCRISAQTNLDSGNTNPELEQTNKTNLIRPLAYQWVFLVDRNGNRIKALSVVGSQTGGIGQLPQRIILAPNTIRFPTHAPVTSSSQTQNTNTLPVNHNQPSAINLGAQPYRMITHMQVSTGPRPVGSNDPVSCVLSGPRLSTDPNKHTVYYIRQPIRAESIRQPLEASLVNSGTKSFPDPHEIRRLDGIRGPSNPQVQAQRPVEDRQFNHQQDSSIRQAARQKLPISSSDSFDDPTFGFSNRPAVKVVSTNTNSGTCSMTSIANLNLQQQNFPTNNQSSQRNPNVTQFSRPAGNRTNVRPMSVVFLGSQTLDNRAKSSRQVEARKENVPSANSMHDLSELLKNNPQLKEDPHRHRILVDSSTQAFVKQRGMNPTSVKRWLSERIPIRANLSPF